MYRRKSQCCPGFYEDGEICARECQDVEYLLVLLFKDVFLFLRAQCSFTFSDNGSLSQSDHALF